MSLKRCFDVNMSLSCLLHGLTVNDTASQVCRDIVRPLSKLNAWPICPVCVHRAYHNLLISVYLLGGSQHELLISPPHTFLLTHRHNEFPTREESTRRFKGVPRAFYSLTNRSHVPAGLCCFDAIQLVGEEYRPKAKFFRLLHGCWK